MTPPKKEYTAKVLANTLSENLVPLWNYEKFLKIMYEFLCIRCITATHRTQRKVSGSLEIKWMKLVAGRVCPLY